MKPLTMSTVRTDNRMLQNKFLLFANAWGARALLTDKCTAPGTHHASNAWGLPGEVARGWN